MNNDEKKLEIPENRPHIQSFCGHKDATLFALKRLRSVMKQTSELRHLTIKFRLKIYTDTDIVTTDHLASIWEGKSFLIRRGPVPLP